MSTSVPGNGRAEALRQLAVGVWDNRFGCGVQERPSSLREGRAATATLLFTDVEGSTRLLRSDAAAYPGRLERHRTVLRRAFAAGVEVDTVGDALFYVFGCARDAIHAAAAGQRALAADQQLAEAGLRVRMGLSTGVVERLGDGYVHAATGESDGADDLRRGSTMLADLGSSLAPQGPHNAASPALFWHGPAAAKELYLEALEYARRIHVKVWELQALGELTWALFDLGEWDELLRVAEEVLAFTGTGGASPASPATVYARSSKARVLALRGDTVAARDAVDGVLDHARAIGETQAAAPALATAALVEFLDGHHEAALRLIDEGLELRSLIYAPVAEMGRILLSLQARDRVQTVIDRASPVPRSLHEAVSVRVMLAEADCDAEAKGLYEEAVSRWRGFGNPLELGYTLTGLTRIQMRLGLATEARYSEREAEALFTNLRVAKPTNSAAAPARMPSDRQPAT